MKDGWNGPAVSHVVVLVVARGLMLMRRARSHFFQSGRRKKRRDEGAGSPSSAVSVANERQGTIRHDVGTRPGPDLAGSIGVDN
jgi:hypothetical protein